MGAHRDYFHFLAFRNNTSVNIYISVFVWTCFHFSWADFLGVDLLFPVFSPFEEEFFKVAAQLYLPISGI